MAAKTLRALHAFHANGRFVADGDEVPADDPIVSGREALFETVDDAPEKPKAPAKKAAAVKKAAPKADG